MFAAVDEALARLYPSRRWEEREDGDNGAFVVGATRGTTLSDALARRLGVMTLFRPGGPDEYCDYVYALCFGRQPSLLELREGSVSIQEALGSWGAEPPQGLADGDGANVVEEIHLRIALSVLAPFAAVQQVSLRMEAAAGALEISEIPRTGVFDPVLLLRYQKLVALLAELDVRNIDFGDMTAAPPRLRRAGLHCPVRQQSYDCQLPLLSAASIGYHEDVSRTRRRWRASLDGSIAWEIKRALRGSFSS
jgi:hypothetical protein